MKNYFYSILFCLLLSCKNEKVEKPVLLSKTDTIHIQHINLKFKTNFKDWKAYLFTFNQPVALKTLYKDGILQINYTTKKINIESKGRIILMNEDTCFTYILNIKNDVTSTQIEKDYRSPKTVNPDSSLHHDKIYYVLDEGQNILSINNQIFHQEQVLLPPKVQTLNAIKLNNLSSFYVQPGSVTNIQINVKKDSLQKNFIISTNILKDKYNNIVANGTKICFEGKKNNSLSKSFAPTINGVATIYLPIEFYKGSSLMAISNTIYSNIITLN